jgi:hypothetical protein
MLTLDEPSIRLHNLQVSVAGEPAFGSSANREPGAIPGRPRRCNRALRESSFRLPLSLPSLPPVVRSTCDKPSR